MLENFLLQTPQRLSKFLNWRSRLVKERETTPFIEWFSFLYTISYDNIIAILVVIGTTEDIWATWIFNMICQQKIL